MDIPDLLIPEHQILSSERNDTPVPEQDFMHLWEQIMNPYGFRLKKCTDKNTLTDAIISPTYPSPFVVDTPIHIKLIGRHMNSSFRCHIGTGKASRPIRSTELDQQMRLLAIFFRVDKENTVSPDFIFFPTWLLHGYRYTQYGSTPGRTDVRFLRDASQAKEHHIYSFNHILNSMFRFNLHTFDITKLRAAIELANFLFDRVTINQESLPPPSLLYTELPALYRRLGTLLNQERPVKSKPLCCNCRANVASRQKRCVACYRYQHKHKLERPLTFVVKNGRLPRRPLERGRNACSSSSSSSSRKVCANCGVHETHQWYRNLVGEGRWCETCKSYFFRHQEVRPSALYLKVAERKVDTRSLANWSVHEFEADPQADLLGTVIARQPSAATYASSLIKDSWIPSGCRPHLYHSRNNCNNNSSSSSSSTRSSNSNHSSPSPSPVTPSISPDPESVKLPDIDFSTLPSSLPPSLFY
ncbi:hypothetical protein EC973_001133 [Apophysomyces ossiformis]|uniref:GATA-type domain-containing protein n=1 Tax=Apophysomyces ossiformis TaxID=679940 RepID=A0A8H7ES49_9FUNG|nr:hypothetical protein EC973_001133 [Apophysomyces ossiformis]